MNLAEQLDNSLRDWPRFDSAREGRGSIWLSDHSADLGRSLNAVARDLRSCLDEIGFLVGPVANEPTALGSSPCLHVVGVRGESHAGEDERLVIVSQPILNRLRDVQAQLQTLNRRDPSYDNVKEFATLVRQGLFLSRRSVKDIEARVERIRKLTTQSQEP